MQKKYLVFDPAATASCRLSRAPIVRTIAVTGLGAGVLLGQNLVNPSLFRNPFVVSGRRPTARSHLRWRSTCLESNGGSLVQITR
jgi:hypothetical protein